MTPPTKKGFTLIELMIIVIIIAILAAIAIPKFSYLIAKSRESTTKGNLGALRSALSIYYGEVEGVFPLDDLAGSIVPQFLPEIPSALYPKTVNSVGHEGKPRGVATGAAPAGITDVAADNAWLYDNDPMSGTYGHILPNCSHTDYMGSAWSSL